MTRARLSRLSVVALGLAIVGLGASIASLIDYLGASATFCAETGCDTVRASAWAHPLGVPMPVFGVVFFAAAIGASFAGSRRLRLALAIAGGAWAVLLIGVQAFSIGAWCKLCMVADPAAIAYAVAVLAGAGAIRLTLPRALAVVPAGLAVVGLLALWTHKGEPEGPVDAPPVASSAPQPAAASPAGAAAGRLPGFVAEAEAAGAVLVEVVDFECPFCRRLQAQLDQAIERIGRPVRIVRKMSPLAMHPHAMPAALAYCCADAQGKGEAMAAALFAAPPDDLTPEGCEKLAEAIGCDLDQYRRDLPAAQRRVASEMAEVSAAGITALPTLFIGSDKIVGAGKSTDQLTQLIASTAR